MDRANSTRHFPPHSQHMVQKDDGSILKRCDIFSNTMKGFSWAESTQETKSQPHDATQSPDLARQG